MGNKQTGVDLPRHSLGFTQTVNLTPSQHACRRGENRVTNKITAVISCQMKSTDFKAACCCRRLPWVSAFIASALGWRDHSDKPAECCVVVNAKWLKRIKIQIHPLVLTCMHALHGICLLSTRHTKHRTLTWDF